MAARLISYMERHGLGEPMQSGYKSLHSTETALLRVHNDILCLVTKRLCSSFGIYLQRLTAWTTVSCWSDCLLLTELRAFSLLARVIAHRATQAVKIGHHVSEHRMLQCGVLQGSVLGPILFKMYSAPIGNIVRKHGLTHHLSAYDTQLYISLGPDIVASAVKRVEVCIAEIVAWMGTNKLMLDDGKTEAVFTRRPRHAVSETAASAELGRQDCGPHSQA